MLTLLCSTAAAGTIAGLLRLLCVRRLRSSKISVSAMAASKPGRHGVVSKSLSKVDLKYSDVATLCNGALPALLADVTLHPLRMLLLAAMVRPCQPRQACMLSNAH